MRWRSSPMNPVVSHTTTLRWTDAAMGVNDGVLPASVASYPAMIWRVISSCGDENSDPAFRFLAQRLPDDQPIFGLFLPDHHPLPPLPRPYPIEDAAPFHLEPIRRRQPSGPYSLGGFCDAGLLAYEIPRRIEASGDRVAALILIDTMNPRAGRHTGFAAWLKHHRAQAAKGTSGHSTHRSRQQPSGLSRGCRPGLARRRGTQP